MNDLTPSGNSQLPLSSKTTPSSSPRKKNPLGVRLNLPTGNQLDPEIATAWLKLSEEHARLPSDKKMNPSAPGSEKIIKVWDTTHGDLKIHAAMDPDHAISRGAFKTVYTGDVADSGAKVAIAESTFDTKGEDVVKRLNVGTREMEVCDPTKFPPHLPYVVYPISIAIEDQGQIKKMIIVMPLMEGGSLDKLKSRVLADEPAVRLSSALQFIRAVSGLHENGIFQRDINPTNAMFPTPVNSLRDAEVKLIDMGTHNRIDTGQNLTLPEVLDILKVKITPYYASPELAALKDHLNADGTIGSPGVDYSKMPGLLKAREMLYRDGRVDPAKVRDFILSTEVYSACVSAYEILMGSLPPHLEAIKKSAETEPSTALAVARIIQFLSTVDSVPKEIPADLLARALARGVPKDLIQKVWSGLSLDPQKRPPLSAFDNFKDPRDRSGSFSKRARKQLGNIFKRFR